VREVSCKSSHSPTISTSCKCRGKPYPLAAPVFGPRFSSCHTACHHHKPFLHFGLKTWCAREDLNLQSFRNQILSLARLPFRHARVGEKMAWNKAKLKKEAPANSQRLNYFFEAAPFFLPFSGLVGVLASVVFLRVSNSLRSSRLDFCNSRTSWRKFLKSSTGLRPARRSV